MNLLRSTATCLAGLAVWLLLLSVPGTASAQSELRGKVINRSSGEPLASVHVYIPRMKTGTVTAEDGSYHLSQLPGESITVEFSRVGFDTRAFEVDLSAGGSTTFDVSLRPGTVEVREINVTSNRPGSVEQLPLATFSVDVYGRAERGRLSLWEDLDRLPGVARSTNGPGIERPYIRGLSAGRLLIFMQSVPYAFQTWDPEAGLAMNGNGTEHVDVILGPSTLMYGPGAMGGVIDLRPDHPAPVGQTVGSYTGRFSSNTLGFYNALELKKSTEKWFWGVQAGYDSNADYKAGGEFEEEGDTGGGSEEEEGRVPNSRFDHIQAQAFAGISRSWGSARLTYGFLRHRNGIVEAEEEEMEGEEEGEREIEAPYHLLQDHLATLDTHYRIGSGWLHGVVGIQANLQQEFEPEGEDGAGEEGEEAAVDLNLKTFHYRFDYQMPLGHETTFTGGIQGAMQDNESEGEEPFIPGFERPLVGAFSLLEWHRDMVTLQGGLRYDVQSIETRPAEREEETGTPGGEEAEIERTFRFLSGSIGGTYRAGEGRVVKANFGIGNRGLDVAELTANGLLREVRRYLIGNVALDVETNAEGDLSVDWQFPDVSFSVGGFYDRIFNYTYLEADGTLQQGFPVFRYRQGDSNFIGGHAGISIHPAALHGAKLFSRFDYVQAELSDAPGDPLPMIPASHLLNGVEWSHGAWGPLSDVSVSAEVDTYLKQDRVASWESESEGYSLFNLSVNARIPRGTHDMFIGLHGMNLLNESYTSHLSLLKQDGIPDMGRSVTLTAVIPFSM